MNISQGIVKAVSERPAGNGIAYNFCTEDGTWYGFGFDKPKFGKGDYIKFTWTARGAYKNVDPKTVEILDAQSSSVSDSAGQSIPSNTPAAGISRSVPATNWDEKDRRITMLACRKDAIEITKMAIETGAIKLGNAKNKQAILLEAVDSVASDLFYGIYGEDFPLHTVAVDSIAEEVTDNEE
jgi:hypothetical protein